jgi:hypothetical protein
MEDSIIWMFMKYDARLCNGFIWLRLAVVACSLYGLVQTLGPIKCSEFLGFLIIVEECNWVSLMVAWGFVAKYVTLHQILQTVDKMWSFSSAVCFGASNLHPNHNSWSLSYGALLSDAVPRQWHLGFTPQQMTILLLLCCPSLAFFFSLEWKEIQRTVGLTCDI